jgi:hypothetical protein
VTVLEEATIALGEALRSVEFGQRLQQWHPSRRSADRPFGSLASYELNSGPAIRRTLQTLHLTRLAGETLQLSGRDQEYVLWIERALLAIQRIAGRCWVPIPARIRTLVVDEDDLGPNASHYIPASREHQLGPALRFAKLDTPQVEEMIDRVAASCRDTPCHRDAAELAEHVGANPDLMQRLNAHRARTLEQLNFGEKLTIGEADERGRAVVRAAYDHADKDVTEVARAFRALNELIQLHAIRDPWACRDRRDCHRRLRYRRDQMPPKAASSVGSFCDIRSPSNTSWASAVTLHPSCWPADRRVVHARGHNFPVVRTGSD